MLEHQNGCEMFIYLMGSIRLKCKYFVFFICSMCGRPKLWPEEFFKLNVATLIELLRSECFRQSEIINGCCSDSSLRHYPVICVLVNTHMIQFHFSIQHMSQDYRNDSSYTTRQFASHAKCVLLCGIHISVCVCACAWISCTDRCASLSLCSYVFVHFVYHTIRHICRSIRSRLSMFMLCAVILSPEPKVKRIRFAEPHMYIAPTKIDVAPHCCNAMHIQQQSSKVRLHQAYDLWILAPINWQPNRTWSFYSEKQIQFYSLLSHLCNPCSKFIKDIFRSQLLPLRMVPSWDDQISEW